MIASEIIGSPERFDLPDNFENSPVSVIVLANNRFHGCVPASLGNMTNLNEIILMNNAFRSCLPSEIGFLNLTVFDIPLFYEMDKKWLNVLCDRLKPVIYTSGSQIVLEGDAVDEILFIARGELTVTTVDEENHDFCSTFLRAGDFCGEELITWAMDPKSSKVNYPFSDRTIETRSEVEAYALMADDLKHVFSLSQRLHGKHLRHAFRFYSSRWRKWAACYIQVAWRSHCRMKIEKALREAEETTQNEALANQQGSPPSLGATIYASRFATNVLRNSRRNSISVEENDTITVHLISPPPKPAEPDFIT